MHRNYDRELKDAFPPTPQVFTISMNAALRSLPREARRWKMPGFTLAAYAFAACAVFVGVFLFAVPAVAPLVKDSPTAAPSPTMLPVISQSVFQSADGWQAVAVSTAANWYFNPKTGELGRVGFASALAGTNTGTQKVTIVAESRPTGASASPTNSDAISKSDRLHNIALAADAAKQIILQASSMPLDIPAGYTVDPYTFLPSTDGRWVAFTLHGPKGDSVWVVTQDGRKMAVPEDVQWMDTTHSSIQADFSGAKIKPMGNSNRFLSESDLCNSENNGLLLCATLPSGDMYFLQVLLNTDKGNAACLLDDKRGTYYYGLTPSENQTILVTRDYMYEVTRGNDGTYTIHGGNGQYPVDLKSPDVALARFSQSKGIFSKPAKVLLIYAGDTSKTLWELDLKSGRASSIATGCVGADWIDENTYWYSVQADSAAVVLKEPLTTEPQADTDVEKSIMFSVGTGTNEDNGVITPLCEADIMVTLHNQTTKAVDVPLQIPCALTLSEDGKTIWTQNGFKLADALSTEVVDGDENEIAPQDQVLSADRWVTIPPGDYLRIQLPSIPCNFGLSYTLDGTFYNQDPIHSLQTMDNKARMPRDVHVGGTLSEAGMLTVSIENGSKVTYIPFNPSAQAGTLFVQYRIVSGSTVMSSGYLDGTVSLPGSQYDIAPGGSLTVPATSAIPSLAGLPAGQYTLQCYLYDYSQGKIMPWGFSYGYYFDVPVTVSGK